MKNEYYKLIESMLSFRKDNLGKTISNNIKNAEGIIIMSMPNVIKRL